MRGVHIIAKIALTANVALAAAIVSAGAQTPSSTTQAAPIAVSIVLGSDHGLAGTAPILQLTVKNLTNHEVPLHSGRDMYRVHVEGKNGEPPTTMLQRRNTGRLLPGETTARTDEVVSFISSQDSRVIPFQLSSYYDLSKPGKYTVYLEVFVDPDNWLRTNTLEFDIKASAQ